jgi:hypothetical protein
MDTQAHERAHARTRKDKDRFFRVSADSPLSPEQRAQFTGLRYYPYNPALVFTVQAEPVAADRAITITTTTGDLRLHRRFARFTVTIEGVSVSLTLYDTGSGFFLPFTDADAGTETYPAGRYLDPEQHADGRFTVDFNHAYNPYCAYAEPAALAASAGREPRAWSCPITPPENRLSVSVRAGELLPRGPWVEGG